MNHIKKIYESHRNNRKTGIIFIAVLTFWTLFILIVPSLANPFYAIVYFLLITTIGFYFTLFLIILLYIWAAGHFFENKLHTYLLKNHHFRKICIIALGIIFLIQVSVIASSDGIFPELGAFSRNMGVGAFGGDYIQNNEWAKIDYGYWWTFGFIPYCFALILGAWYFVPLAMMFSMFLIIYGALSLYTGRYDVWNYWLKKENKINKNLSKNKNISEEINLEEIASEENAKEFRKKLNEAQERIVDDSNNYNAATSMVADQIRETIKAKENLEDKQVIFNETERLENLKQEIIKKRQQEKQFRKNKTITEFQKFALLRDLGEISPTLPSKKTIINKNQEQKIIDNYELKSSTPISFVETNIEEFSKAVNDDFNHELFEIFKKTGYEEEVEIPLIENYAGDIFNEADKTLKSTLNMNSKEELTLHKEITAETIIDPKKSELMTFPIESSDEILEIVKEAKETVKNDFEKKISDKIISENLMNSNNILNFEWCKKYKKPQLFLLKDSLQTDNDKKLLREETIVRSGQLDEMFSNFKIEANVSNYIIGSTITTFEIVLQSTVKLSKIVSLEDNIKLTLGVKKIRIIAPIPGKTLVGIEIPNRTKHIVSFKEIFVKSQIKKGELIIALGENVSRKPLIFDLLKTPHLLIAGSPKSNKNSIINLILISLLMHYRPDEFKLMIINTSIFNFNGYREIPHLIAPIVTNVSDAFLALKSIIVEIDKRYALMTKNNTRNILELNEILISIEEPTLPYLIVIIDELANLMHSSSVFVEEVITQIISKANIVGVHLVVATEKPLSNIITKKIKSNFSSKIALQVETIIDSKIIFDQPGAEKLLENGDMLFALSNQDFFRGQGAYLSFEEINDITNFVKKQCKPFYQIDIKQQIGQKVLYSQINNNLDKEIYQDVYDYAILNKKISISIIQKRFKIGYNKAAELITALEQNGIIGAEDGTKTRKILIKGGRND